MNHLPPGCSSMLWTAAPMPDVLIAPHLEEPPPRRLARLGRHRLVHHQVRFEAREVDRAGLILRGVGRQSAPRVPSGPMMPRHPPSAPIGRPCLVVAMTIAARRCCTSPRARLLKSSSVEPSDMHQHVAGHAGALVQLVHAVDERQQHHDQRDHHRERQRGQERVALADPQIAEVVRQRHAADEQEQEQVGARTSRGTRTASC